MSKAVSPLPRFAFLLCWRPFMRVGNGLLLDSVWGVLLGKSASRKSDLHRVPDQAGALLHASSLPTGDYLASADSHESHTSPLNQPPRLCLPPPVFPQQWSR